MKLWFTGAEVAAHRKVLLSEGVSTVALNLSAYFKQRQATEMRDVFDGFEIVLYSSEGGLDPQQVQSFVDINAERFEMVYGLRVDHPRAVPEWNGLDVKDFYAACEQLVEPKIGVGETLAADVSIMKYVVPHARKNKIELVVSSAKAEVLRYGWSEVITSGWTAAAKHRELQVWDGDRVVRYSRSNRQQGVEKHFRQIEAIGCDPQALLDDDPAELTRLAIRSWLLLGRREATVVAIDDFRHVPGAALDDHPAIAIEPVRPRTRERVVLPVLATPSVAEEGSEEGVPGMAVLNTAPLRSCDGCNLSSFCPAFEAGHQCGFHIPVRITTKGELQHAINNLLEMQMGRVVMARFQEDLLSQGIDPMVSAEIERFFRLVESTKRVSENTESLTIVAKSESGVISRLFGAAAGAANTRLSNPIEPNALNAAVIDAEVLDD